MATIDGLPQLLEKLTRLGQVAQGQAMQRAATAGMELIVNAAKGNAPVDTGNLRRSLHVEPGDITSTSASANGGTDVEYAAAVEFGTSTQSAQPYLRPAFDENRDAATNEVQAAFIQLIEAATA